MRVQPTTAVLLAGGFGTRMAPLSPVIPKPLVQVGSRNLLEHNIHQLKEQGIERFLISIHHKGKMIRDHFADGRTHGVEIRYLEEPSPLGDAGAIRLALEMLRSESHIVVANADELRFGLHWDQMYHLHVTKEALVTASGILIEDVGSHGVFEINSDHRITRFLMCPHPNDTASRMVNAGLYLIRPDALSVFPAGPCRMKDVLPSLINTGNCYAHAFVGRYFNVGTPEIHRDAELYLSSTDSCHSPPTG